MASVRQLRYPHFNILIVDNAPRDSATIEIAGRYGVPYVLEPEAGLSRARNLGLGTSDGAIVAFLDDDAVPDPNWLDRLAVEFSDPQVAVVAGRMLELRTAGEAASQVREYYSLDCLGNHKRIVDRDDAEWFELSNFGGIGIGTNMAFRRAALHDWAGFDHRLGRGQRISGSEEHHAFFCLAELGYRLVYAPDALVYHPYPPDLPSLRAHQARHLSSSTAYLAFLFFEEPKYRRRLLRYIIEGIRGIQRTWRSSGSAQTSRVISGVRAYWALLLGPVLYLRTRFESGPGESGRALLNSRVFSRPKVPATATDDMVPMPASNK